MRPRSLFLSTLVCLTLGAIACGGGEPDLPALATAAADATPSPAFNVVAKDIKFNVDTLVVPAGEEITITLDNQDSALHNISVYSQDGGDAIYRGDLFSGPDTREYRFQAPPAGVYYFHCDAHPEMKGVFISR